jgi:hypothetical protein
MKRPSKTLFILVSIAGISVGAFAIIFGEADDSPGLQGLGLLLVIFSAISAYRRWRHQKQR